MTKRKAIQIAFDPSDDDDATLYALRDDGQIFFLKLFGATADVSGKRVSDARWEWCRITPVPND